ncbi:2-succinyl-5-enolpyruvyl-6-hydroxy-3-cyclohexene-1-carboxylic-acid synthase [Prochlorococcus marinus]|jgi:2-succinyl-5-enolpyruvyl-6-hydroxy-3-cyclohexene-1-carboxylate synthase|uniref:2-succinyl-5-enolpyruvyl-6-hydroxy-3-cyclohexene-1-carboxylate synthase n=1 Tax=Prochlorococcus marinus (strain MIT 9301) TaxID=167546 RepID=MEND_PROM0|nr:2-succinyl-5-enolpyruvyl-6-hydroxy-3-cyclohexene-1-carboxylic-acid synthase [Prochlorococcus marinus]A3PBY1.1 RecName: Full=2-succinyl-5-enolpyruvyl-6-hydroxy-3-cyclohexene-1-carboxylate synthase; Short=SEPHCHC synthase [Prochlorococcus marinus str. MIT 9301]ABO17256.1 Menaquinone biosynthesis protein [Prochlorococcus marinus str. MIT 9301]
MTSSIECQNFLRSLQLLNLLIKIGVQNLILCPGSRSAPLAIAAGELNKLGMVNIFNSIDERSAGFHSLGISAASGNLSLVITTSGTAVSNLLPAAVEADRSCKGVIFLTADRPLRLKDCGANQTVNQEDFLSSVCRSVLSTNLNGLHETQENEILNLVRITEKQISTFPGPIHLNIPIDKPLDISFLNKKNVLEVFKRIYLKKQYVFQKVEIKSDKNKFLEISKIFNLDESGIILVGPYQGSVNDLSSFNKSLEQLQEITGWPVFADPVSGVYSDLRGLVVNWELVLRKHKNLIKCKQLLRLGPMSSSIDLENFLIKFEGIQILIKEKNYRKLDPIKKSFEYDFGLLNFTSILLEELSFNEKNKKSLTPLALDLIEEGKQIKDILKDEIIIDNKITEYKLANLVPKLWPAEHPIMLSASSPIRDWLTFSENGTLTRNCFSFRGASGIDGTLSLALGISRIKNPLLLVTGDLAFVHDINGWLIENSVDMNLTILLIDNNGGNIFNRIYKKNLKEDEFKKLFLMPKEINWSKLSESYQVKFKSVSNFKKLREAFDWSISIQKSVIIKVDIDPENEIYEKNALLEKIIGS